VRLKEVPVDTHARRFDRELGEFNEKLLHMASVAENLIEIAIKALVDRDEAVAQPAASLEAELNRLQIEIDELAVNLLATQSPVAGDLRFIVAGTRINNELERIGDLAINITQNLQVLVQAAPVKPLVDIPKMAELARKMVRESLDAYVKGDALLAQSVIMTDDHVDNLKRKIQRDLTVFMKSDPEAVERCLALIFVSRHLERIGDHATNISEEVIFLTQGRDVRHPTTPKERMP
jgi:phosphate transport system protein